MMNTKIETKENNIICTIDSLKYSDRRCNGRVYMDSKRVKRLLIEQDYNPGEVLKESRVDNCDNKLSGTWVFKNLDKQPQIVLEVEEIIEATKKPTTPNTNNKRRNSRKSKKTLDNS